MQSPYLVENRHIAIKNCRHGLFMYSRNDAFVGRGLDLYGEWCDFEIQAIRPHVKPGDTVIDVEGMESLVLAGAKRLIETCKPVIYVENNDQETSARLAKMLPELDYHGFWSIHPYYDARNYYSNTVDVWQNVVWASNLICVPRQSNLNSTGAQPFL